MLCATAGLFLIREWSVGAPESMLPCLLAWMKGRKLSVLREVARSLRAAELSPWQGDESEW